MCSKVWFLSTWQKLPLCHLVCSWTCPSCMLYVSWSPDFHHVVLSARNAFPSPFTYCNCIHSPRIHLYPTLFLITSLNTMPRKRSHTHLAFYTNRCSYICHAYATFYPFSISVIYFAIQYVFESRDNDSFILIFYQAPTRLAPYKSERIIFVDNLNIHI